MSSANIHYAKTHLSKLIDRALAGEEVVIARAGKPLVRLTPVAEGSAAAEQKPNDAWLGAFEGMVRVPTDAEWAEMDRDIERMFEQHYIFPEDTLEGAAERAGEVVRLPSK